LNKNQNWILFMVALVLLINGVFIKALADDDDHHNASKKYNKKYITPVNNPTYAEKSSAKRALKIVRSLRGRTPIRIDKIPYIIVTYPKNGETVPNDTGLEFDARQTVIASGLLSFQF